MARKYSMNTPYHTQQVASTATVAASKADGVHVIDEVTENSSELSVSRGINPSIQIHRSKTFGLKQQPSDDKLKISHQGSFPIKRRKTFNSRKSND